MKHLYDTDSVYFISGFSGMLWKLFYSLLTKEPKNFCFSADKNIAQPEYNTLRHLTYCEQNCSKEIHIYQDLWQS